MAFKELRIVPCPTCRKLDYKYCPLFNHDLKLCETDSSIGFCWLYSVELYTKNLQYR